VKHKLLQKSILIGTIFTTSLLANISGTVFMDYNLNGHQDKDDLGIPYISLHATCDDNSSYQANTNKNGFYEFVINDKINKCRIELNATKQLHTAEYIKNDVHPFVDIAQNNTIYDISVIKPSTYCQNKPDVIIAAYPLYNDNNKTHPQDHGVLFKVPTPPNDIFDNNTSHRTILKIRKELGAIWGLAYDKYHHNIYASSVLMRYVPLHKQQAGAIYKIDANNTMSLFVKLPNKEVGISEKIFPRNLHSLQDYTIEHLIGRAGLGDLDIDEQGQYLYTVNMAKKELLKISTTTKQITKYPIPNPYNKECNSTMVRPWATKVKNGSVYIGSVCENRIEDGIGAAIQKFTDGNFTTVAITNTLRYKRPRGYNPKLPTGPQYQNSNWNNHKHISYPQPILSDIEFTNKGDLILGYSDRAGYMKTREGSHDDIRKMCLNPDGTYTIHKTEEEKGIIDTITETISNWASNGVSAVDAAFRGGGAYAVFAVDYTGSVSESFTNTTTEIETGNTIKQLSRKARDLKFNLAGGNFVEGADIIMNGIKDLAAGALDSVSFGLSSVLQTITGGGYINIPDKWEDSTVSLTNHTFKMKLISPYGNTFSQLQNIYIPLAMILAGALPIATGKASYTSPFLCSLFGRGIQNTKLGIITSVSITRGTSNLGFNKSRRPLAIDVSFTVTDLSPVLNVPIPKGVFAEVFSASFEDDSPMSRYIAVLGGRNILDERYSTRKMALRTSRRLMSYSQLFSGSKLGMMAGSTLENVLGWTVASSSVTQQHTR